MITILILSAIPAVLAVDLDSGGFALLAIAGFVWACAHFASSVAPIVVGAKRTTNETIAVALSTLAALVAVAGFIFLTPLPS